MFSSTKIIELGSCAFRQPQATSHCRFVHGYRLIGKFWFGANELDENNWVVDFGGLKDLKKKLEEHFDHTTVIADNDPALESFRKLHDEGIVDLRVMHGGVGIEKFAEHSFNLADAHVKDLRNKLASFDISFEMRAPLPNISAAASTNNFLRGVNLTDISTSFTVFIIIILFSHILQGLSTIIFTFFKVFYATIPTNLLRSTRLWMRPL